MSLINEALKRTRDGNFQAPQPAVAPPSYNTRHDAATPHLFGLWHFIVVGVIAVSLAVAAYSFYRNKIGALAKLDASVETVPVASTPEPVTPKLATQVEDLAKPIAQEVINQPVQPEKLEPVETTPATVSIAEPAPAPVPVAIPATPPPPPHPDFRLQGIMRDRSIYEAMINGYNYRLGDDVQGWKLVAIDNRGARLQLGEQTLELRLR